jgi:hypothetical protein
MLPFGRLRAGWAQHERKRRVLDARRARVVERDDQRTSSASARSEEQSLSSTRALSAATNNSSLAEEHVQLRDVLSSVGEALEKERGVRDPSVTVASRDRTRDALVG